MRTVRRSCLWLLVFVPALLPAGCLLFDSAMPLKNTASDRFHSAPELDRLRLPITQIEFSPDGNHCLTVGSITSFLNYHSAFPPHSCQVSLWTCDDDFGYYFHNRSNNLYEGLRTAKVRFLSDGKSFGVFNSRGAEIRETETGALRRQNKKLRHYDLDAFDVSSDWRFFARNVKDDEIIVHHIETLETEFILRREAGVGTVLTFSPDGRYLLSKGQTAPKQGVRQSALILWDLKTRTVARVIPAGGLRLGDYARFSPDGRLIAASCIGNQDAEEAKPETQLECVKIWDTDTGKLVANLSTPGKSAWSMAFSADGERFAAGFGLTVRSAYSAEVVVWDIETWKRTDDWKHTDSVAVTALAFSPNSMKLAIGTSSGRVHLFPRCQKVAQDEESEIFIWSCWN